MAASLISGIKQHLARKGVARAARVVIWQHQDDVAVRDAQPVGQQARLFRRSDQPASAIPLQTLQG